MTNAPCTTARAWTRTPRSGYAIGYGDTLDRVAMVERKGGRAMPRLHRDELIAMASGIVIATIAVVSMVMVR